jgi:hypothetical protein
MESWRLFWTVFLLVSGVSFAFITVVVTVKGFRDLLDMFSGLTEQKEETHKHLS